MDCEQKIGRLKARKRPLGHSDVKELLEHFCAATDRLHRLQKGTRWPDMLYERKIGRLLDRQTAIAHQISSLHEPDRDVIIAIAVVLRVYADDDELDGGGVGAVLAAKMSRLVLAHFAKLEAELLIRKRRSVKR